MSAAVLLLAAAALNPVCLALAPPALAVILGYSLAKRFTVAAHLWLGAALGIAPVGAWIAVSGRLDWPALLLAAAVGVWVAGFDVIYSLQDELFDRSLGLRIPRRKAASGVGIDAMIPGKKLVAYRAPGAAGAPSARLSLAPFVTPRAKGVALALSF